MVLDFSKEVASDGSVRWKESQEVFFTIVHEFGHALGLYHENQHPQYLKVMRNYCKSDEEMCKIMKGKASPEELAAAVL